MSRESLHASTVDALVSWSAPDPEQDALRHAYLAFLAATDDACLRRCEAGHITASTIVVDASREHVLLTLHPRVGAWIQLGGHCEPSDATIADAALREAREESGIADLELSGPIVHLHTHPITCSLGVPTRHLDIRFRAVTPPTVHGELPAIMRSDESVDLRWWPVDALPESARSGDMASLIARGVGA
ncbi:NUDIX hydrolase [Gordonia bronchialis DSM 43247]|uniref:NUDIX hydrolase n=1 Tax=Gordonia bronchialis (strain ATCC 25592 / DSM 43247 / BCRC 13721 / JCM 3198 / KCTC 3076 / NBRC 16047 / NCTC 10667) TaxID=526226 RepID=D0LD15_GORB4|nr:NUDIX domain-containing protein [Gordonia bronchialis]ACY22508.1 NUDIX hydrolase [Gordonia bronchialis DSM 43247]MCC3325293.1 NUDIX domain-containing protein [Gordonia bronchialis]QGS23987.1 NUDIX domain-containing protein [Gordonia bronchialis]UAK39835.1 NUDIX domain-containing protein [Gordonia bronchialis]STQ65437.1 NUDIX domain [Gordonia bronchialis]